MSFFSNSSFKSEFIYHQDKWILVLLFSCIALILLLITTMIAIEFMEYYERLELIKDTTSAAPSSESSIELSDTIY